MPGALGLIKRHAGAGLTLTARPAGRYPRTRGLPGDWAPLVFNDTGKGGRRVVRAVYEICTFQALRERLRCKDIWVAGAGRRQPRAAVR